MLILIHVPVTHNQFSRKFWETHIDTTKYLTERVAWGKWTESLFTRSAVIDRHPSQLVSARCTDHVYLRHLVVQPRGGTSTSYLHLQLWQQSEQFVTMPVLSTTGTMHFIPISSNWGMSTLLSIVLFTHIYCGVKQRSSECFEYCNH